MTKILLLLLLSVSALGADWQGTVVKVHDGDTVTFHAFTGERFNVRLEGIDAPELSQPFGLEARRALERLVLKKPCTLTATMFDIFHRTLGSISVDGKSSEVSLVSKGFAWVFTRYLRTLPPVRQIELGQAQADAKAAKLGLWSDPNAEAPWKFRQKAHAR